jgi:hypothetical protein
MNVLQAAEIVLKEAGTPLHYKEITQRMIDNGLWQTEGMTPDATVNANIAVDIKHNGTHSRFQRTDRGIFALRDWSLPEFHTSDEPTSREDYTHRTVFDTSTTKSFSFTDAAEQVRDMQKFVPDIQNLFKLGAVYKGAGDGNVFECIYIIPPERPDASLWFLSFLRKVYFSVSLNLQPSVASNAS